MEPHCALEVLKNLFKNKAQIIITLMTDLGSMYNPLLGFVLDQRVNTLLGMKDRRAVMKYKLIPPQVPLSKQLAEGLIFTVLLNTRTMVCV